MENKTQLIRLGAYTALALLLTLPLLVAAWFVACGWAGLAYQFAARSWGL